MLRGALAVRTASRSVGKTAFVRPFGAGGNRDHLWPDGQRKIATDWGTLEGWHDPLPILPKEQDPNMPKQIIVEERGKKWIKPLRTPESIEACYGIPQHDVPFYARNRMRIWGN